MIGAPNGVTTIDIVVDVITQLHLNRGLPVKGTKFELSVYRTIKKLEDEKGILVVGKRR